MIASSSNSHSKTSTGTRGNMLRIVHGTSNKVIFTTIIVFCLLGICIIYLADIRDAISRSVNITFSKLTQEEPFVDRTLTRLPSKNNMSIKAETRHQPVNESTNLNTTTLAYLQKQKHGDVDDERHSLKNISKNTTAFKMSKANNSYKTVTPEVFSMASTMTFNKTLVVHCKESPYIECFSLNLKPSSGKIFKIAILRRPKWLPKFEINISSCNINHCVFNETTVTNETDMVFVYGVGLKDNFRVKQRWPHQLYALQVWESPFHTHSDYITNGRSVWNNQINIIMSYRLDSEIVSPYGRLKFSPKPLDQRPNYYEIAKTKTRTAVWVVSHCKTFSQREKYVKEMQKYLDVDILGGCGTPCSKKSTICNDWSSKYKFYLSFENSLCTDYVTEKFFKIFDPSIYVIPVVRGGADYDKHFPNFTYINSAHFKTPKDLALHLKNLASDLDTYSKYLEYKDLYTLIQVDKACQICSDLHTQKLPQITRIYNLQQHLVDGQCHSPTDF